MYLWQLVAKLVNMSANEKQKLNELNNLYNLIVIFKNKRQTIRTKQDIDNFSEKWISLANEYAKDFGLFGKEMFPFQYKRIFENV